MTSGRVKAGRPHPRHRSRELAHALRLHSLHRRLRPAADAHRRHPGRHFRAADHPCRPRADAGDRYVPCRRRRPRHHRRNEARRFRLCSLAIPRTRPMRQRPSASTPPRSKSCSTCSSPANIFASQTAAIRLTPRRPQVVAPLTRPHSLHDNLMLRFLEWQAIDVTEDFVRTGKALDVHDLIAGDQWDTYQRGMRSLARFSADEVARRVPLAAGATAMLDIGGGHGSLFRRLLQASSRSSGRRSSICRRQSTGPRRSSPRRRWASASSIASAMR